MLQKGTGEITNRVLQVLGENSRNINKKVSKQKDLFKEVMAGLSKC